MPYEETKQKEYNWTKTQYNKKYNFYLTSLPVHSEMKEILTELAVYLSSNMAAWWVNQ